jgi:uncharacterized membrane protein
LNATKDNFCPVRWKLLIITSLVAALINAGGMRALVYWMKATPLSEQPEVLSGLIIIPLVVTTLACIFVYRHTARRRKLQGALIALFALVMTVAALFIIAQIFPTRTVEVGLLPAPPPQQSAT